MTRSDYAARQLTLSMDKDCWAMPDGPRSHPPGQALLRVLAADAVSIAIAVFAASWFVAALVSGAGQ